MHTVVSLILSVHTRFLHLNALLTTHPTLP
nr:MAG TPA: hypothetical protein [Caudoviricetes sp.]